MLRMGALTAGFLLDLWLGDPEGRWHPVCAVGQLIARLERVLRACFPKTPGGELAAGCVLAVTVPAVTGGLVWGILYLAGIIHPAVRFLAESILCYQMLAVKSLKDASMKVYGRLKAGDTEGARKAVSMIVGRDTQRLTEEGIIKAAVETVAENTSDGVIAPLLYMALGGAVWGWVYKAVNTMDSMVGYRNERYLYFGRAAARLDDAANWIPARLSALLMIGAAVWQGLNAGNGWRIYRRDRYCHKSPNSAHTEAVCAGALEVQLAGDAWYFGKRYEKPTIGDDTRPVEAEDIVRANGLLYKTAWLAVLLEVAIWSTVMAVMFTAGR